MKALSFVTLHLLFAAAIAIEAAWYGPLKDNVTGSSYYISKELAAEPDASTSCRLNGWILATVRTASQQRTLQRLANAISGRKTDIWIGLTLYQNKSMKDKGYGVWSDGEPFRISKDSKNYHNWDKHEPQTFRTTTQKNQPTCVRLWMTQRWKWDDYYCNYEKAPLIRYACESKNKDDYVAKDLRRISTDFIENSNKVKPTTKNLESLANAVNELLTVDESFHEVEESSSRKVIGSLDEFLNDYDAEKDGDFNADKKNIEINVTLVAKNHSIFVAPTRSSRKTNNIQIYLSVDLIEEASSRNPDKSETVQVNSICYRNPSLFQLDRTKYTKGFSKESNFSFESRSLNAPIFGEDPTLNLVPVLISEVLSVDVKNVKMDDLKNPVCITNYDFYQNYTPPKIPDMIAKVQPVCAFWDMKANEWSTRGCRVLKPLEEDKFCGKMTNVQNRSQRVICACNHMTHFSMLLDTRYTYAPKYLTHITVFGCSISIICLFASIVTILTFRQLRTKTPQQILLQLCIMLLIMNVIFLIGIDRNYDTLACTVTSALLHYFLLTAWAFMLLEAVFLSLRLVTPSYHGGVEGKVVPIGSALCYGLPGLIAGVTVGVTRTDVYLSEKYCWLSMHVLIPTLLVPIALILLCNIVMFIAVIYTITFKSKMFRKRVNMFKIRQTLTRAICMIFILGIPWLFGFFMLLSQKPTTKEVFAVCFTILNTTQGVAIFFFFIARQEQVRKLWLVPLNHKVRRAVRRVKSRRSVRSRSRSDTKKSDKLLEDSSDKSLTDDTRSKSLTNERSMVTYPGSQTTVETNTHSTIN